MSTSPTAAMPATRRERAFEWLVVVGLMALGIGLRLPLAQEPLWVDELHTGWVVADGLEHLPSRARLGNQSPLWFLLPWATTRWQFNEWTLRLPSLVAGLAILPIFHIFARQWTGRIGAGVVAMALAVLDQRFGFYATEARGYACVQLLGLLHLGLWIRTIKVLFTKTYGDPNTPRGGLDSLWGGPREDRPSPEPARSWITRGTWLLTGVLLYYAHYTTALIFVAQAVAELVAWLCSPPPRARSFRGIDYGLLSLAILPSLPHLSGIAAHRDDWAQTLSAESIWTVFPWAVAAVPPALMVAASWLWEWSRGRVPAPGRISLWLVVALALWIAVPWAIAAVATGTDVAQLVRYRYLLVSATALPLFAGIAYALIPGRIGRAALIVAVLALAVQNHGALSWWLRHGHWPPDRTEDWRGLVQQLNQQAPADRRPILLCPTLVEDRHLAAVERSAARPEIIEFCAFPLHSLYRLEDQRAGPASHSRFGAGPIQSMTNERVVPLSTLVAPRLDRELRERLRLAGGCWLVVRGGPELADAIAGALTRELKSERQIARPLATFDHGGVQLVELEMSIPSAK